jgi:hypothetical protein
MNKQSALILAFGFIIGTIIICFGCVSLGKSIILAGNESRTPHQINLKILEDSPSLSTEFPDKLEVKLVGDGNSPVGLEVNGKFINHPIRILNETK